MGGHRRPSTGLLWATIVAAPLALGFETLLRALLFPDDFELIRDFLGPTLTWVAWGLAGLAVVGSLLGTSLQRRMAKQRLSALDGEATLAQRFAALSGIFLLTTALPQIPSLLATLCFMFGSELMPVLAALTITTAGVVAQAVAVPRLASPR